MSMNFSSSLKTPRKNPKVPSKSGCKYKGVFQLNNKKNTLIFFFFFRPKAKELILNKLSKISSEKGP
jgi:hypothetical protein